MRKVFSILLVCLMMLSLVSCTSEKTTVANEEEWKALFDTAKYKNSKAKHVIKTDDIVESTLNVVFNDDIMVITNNGADSFTSYFYIDKDNLREVYLEEIGEGIYGEERYEDTSLEELEATYSSMITNYSYGEDFSSRYADAIYNKKTKAYEFSYMMYEEIEINVSIKVLNNRIIEVEELFNSEEMDIRSITNISFDDVPKISLPDTKNTINTEEEWKALFDEDKYTNVTVTNRGDENTLYVTVDDKKMEYYIYLPNGISQFYIEKPVGESAIATYHIDEEGNVTKELIPYDENSITYEQRRYSDVVGIDNSSKYSEVKYEDGYYVLSIDKGDYIQKISYGISNGHIVHRIEDILVDDEIVSRSDISYYAFGESSVELPIVE